MGIRIAFLFVATLALAACQEAGPTTVTSEGILGGNVGGLEYIAEEERKADCVSRGGTFAAGGASGLMTCFTTPKDAGKACSAGSECSTNMCLARSRTCAPISPMFGCHEIIEQGGSVTLCID